MGNVNVCDAQCVKGGAALSFVNFQLERDTDQRKMNLKE